MLKYVSPDGEPIDCAAWRRLYVGGTAAPPQRWAGEGHECEMAWVGVASTAEKVPGYWHVQAWGVAGEGAVRKRTPLPELDEWLATREEALVAFKGAIRVLKGMAAAKREV